VLFARAFDNHGILARLRHVRNTPVLAYGIALLAVIIATLLRFPIAGPLAGAGPFTTYSLAIIISALVCGFWPAILAVLLSVVTGWYLFLLPAFSFALSERAAWTLGMFALVAAINVVLVSGLVGGLLIHDERQRFLIRELKHRSQNLFAVIQTITSRSLVEGQTIGEAREVLNGRLAALASAYTALAESSFSGASLHQMLAQELSAFPKQIRITGKDILLNTPAAQNFALIIHELATNAIKYGALSCPEGQVHVDCNVVGANGSGQFRFVWRESGGPPVRPPTRKGFGSAILFEIAKSFAPTANVQANHAPDGLVYEIQVPLSAIEAPKLEAPTLPQGAIQAAPAGTL
jgi:two-component sensor histidine kinase